MADNCIKITDIHEGLDFFFGNRGHALKLIDFLQVCFGVGDYDSVGDCDGVDDVDDVTD